MRGERFGRGPRRAMQRRVGVKGGWGWGDGG